MVRRLERPDLPVPFALQVRPDRDVVHVEAVGELDVATVRPLRAQLQELVDAGFRHLVLDLRDLVFIDASGVRLLLETHAAAQRQGWRLSLIQGPAPIRRVFELTETLDVLPFESPTTVAPRVHASPAGFQR